MDENTQQLSVFEQGMGFYQNEDYPNAAKCFAKAAEEGSAEAQFCLGNLYAEGQGVSRNDKQSISWFHKAAEQGYTPAQVNLGFIYAQGRGIAKNLVEAHKWINIAGGAIDEDGVNLLKVIEEDMTQEGILEAMRLAKDWVRAYHRRGLG